MNKFQELFTKYQPDVPSDKAQPAIGEIVLAMRKDLRQKTSLHNDAFVYWNILP
jgi:hypothetical protein